MSGGVLFVHIPAGARILKLVAPGDITVALKLDRCFRPLELLQARKAEVFPRIWAVT